MKPYRAHQQIMLGLFCVFTGSMCDDSSPQEPFEPIELEPPIRNSLPPEALTGTQRSAPPPPTTYFLVN